jgi:hypothetical protein
MRRWIGILALSGLLAGAPRDDWWNKDWAHRRSLGLRTRRELPLSAGTCIGVTVRCRELGIRERGQPDLADLRLVYRGREVPYELRPLDDPPGAVRIRFPLQADLTRRNSPDAGYAFYYGNPKAAPPAYGRAALTHFFVEPASKQQVAEKLQIDSAIRSDVEAAGLWIRGVDASATAQAPARILLKCPPPGRNQAVRVKIHWTAPEAGNEGGVALLAGSAESPRADPATAERIAALVRDLGHDAADVREAATLALVELGMAALEPLREAVRSPDLEVAARARRATAEIQSRHRRRQSMVGVRWAGGEATAFGSWNLESPPGVTRTLELFPQFNTVTLVLRREEDARGVEIVLRDYTHDFIDANEFRLMRGIAPAEEFKLLVWGGGDPGPPPFVIQDVAVSAEATYQAAPTDSDMPIGTEEQAPR